MQILKTALITLTGAMTISAPAVVYHKNKTTVGEELKGKILPDAEDVFLDDWKILEEKLNNKSVNDQELKKIGQEHKTGESIKQWCTNSYFKTYKNIFWNISEDLFNDIKTVCSLTMKDKLGADHIFAIVGENTEEKNKSEFINKFSLLKDETLELTKELRDIKDKQKAEENWKELELWCKKAYEWNYEGSNTKEWKLTEKFCKK